MKNIKKMISGLMALTLAISTNVVSVNATTTYLKGDIDGNGTVNLIDSITMVQYLKGNISADGATAERLDVNRDYVINSYDKEILTSIVLGDMSSTTMQSVDTTSLPQSENREYYKYNFKTNNSSYYNLYAVNNVIAPSRGIIGTDDRVQEDGLSGVVKIGGGTAFVVDSHTLLTAAHMIHNTQSFITNLDITFYGDYNEPLNISVTPTAYHVPVKYIEDSANRWKYDYGIVTVEEDLSSYINFDLGVMRDGMSRNKPVYITGFGGAGDNVESSLVGMKSTGIGMLSPVNTPDYPSYWNYAIYHTADAVGGDSGAPVYVVNTDGSKTVIGIENYGAFSFNQGTRITTDIIQFVYNNSNL